MYSDTDPSKKKTIGNNSMKNIHSPLLAGLKWSLQSQSKKWDETDVGTHGKSALT